MRMKMVVVDLELSKRAKRIAATVAVPLLVLAGSAVAYAGEVHEWKDGDPLTAVDLNTAFKEVVPAGSVMAYAGAAAPTGWLLCDGSAQSRVRYPTLFQALGVAHGSGDGTTTFNLPDYRGRFLRGLDQGTQRDPDAKTRTAAAAGGSVGDAVGSIQADAFQGWKPRIITRAGNNASALAQDSDYVLYSTTPFSGSSSGPIFRNDTYGFMSFGDYGSPRVSSETRPQNASVIYLIKY
jgi:microcystin-dependent protein